ncbi:MULTISPECIES: protein-glutamine gamma-glutamyltransferase [Paenibacillus]|uniref:Protein-glutamine gamma-glutamyltransferase n=1 Tax=Paenibacillus albilobatus TaxID=2716884 RepID=A0A919XF17_9BACL|nr:MULTISPECIES: protein-glutamine gamma-glutamyltransferase [Paenibacillus]GIO29647.1 protein-glutamine gamma-glutamyltransferase [Paenibacillus albilobatus]
MIRIGNEEAVLETGSWPPLWQKIVNAKRSSPTVFRYVSLGHLRFELRLRTAIVEAAKALKRSGVQFEDFEHSHCNERYWNLNRQGGFELRPDVTPAEGIRDIFVNGPRYGFECATAIVIVLYKGLLDCIHERDFNRMFADLLLYDWHYDSDLRLIEKQGVSQSFPGDVLYFKNPDVNPRQIEWQGENTVKLEEDLYYGHGIGIASSQAIIAKLNRHRKPGSTVSAYLTDQVISPDFLYLSQYEAGGSEVNPEALEQNWMQESGIVSRIGRRRYWIA